MSQVTELLIRIKQQGDQQLTRLQGNLKSLAQQTSATNVNFKELSTELKQIQQTSVNSINNLRGYANTWREIANSVKIGSAEFKQATAEAARLEAQLQKVQPRGGGLRSAAKVVGTAAGAAVFGGFEGGAGALLGGLVGGVPGAIVGGGIGAQLGGVRQMLGGTATYAADISRQRQALQLVTKNASEYQRALAFIDKTSRELAIPQDILTKQFTQLTAAVKGSGGNVRDAETAFKGVAAGIRGTGGDLQALDGALLATSQVFSKGKVSAEELRQQIGERLPGAFSLFASSLKMTPQELDKALQNGQVSLVDFQKFALRLFAEYGENAKIIANGPDAAGDRLKTSLARLSESVGKLLKPIGAGFQNIFTDVINIIDKAVRKFNEFAKIVGQKDLARMKTEFKAQEQLVRDYEKAGGKKAQAGSILAIEYAKALEKRNRLKAEIIRAEIPEKPLTTKEPPSNLPTIDTTQKGTKIKIPVQRLADMTAKFEEQRILAAKNLHLQDLILTAKQKGYKYDEAVLPLLGNILQANTKIRLAQEHLKDLQQNKNKLLKNGMSLEEYTARIQSAQDALSTQRLNRKAAYKILQQQEFDISKRLFDEEINARQQINLLIEDAKMKGVAMSQEDLRRIEINKILAQTIEAFADKLTAPELLDAIRELRKAMEGAATASEDFGTKFAKSFADSIKATGDLATNLGNTIGNAFLGLSDQLFEFVSTGKASFADFTRSVLMDFSKIFIQFAMFQTLKSIVPGGSALGKFLGFANGGIMTANGPLDLKRYAAGGIASSPQLAMFGEGSRPEAYVPLPDGRTIPVTMKNGGGGVNVSVNVDASGSSVEGDGAQANQLGKVIGIAVQQELIKQKRPGGLLA